MNGISASSTAPEDVASTFIHQIRDHRTPRLFFGLRDARIRSTEITSDQILFKCFLAAETLLASVSVTPTTVLPLDLTMAV